jgi:hypothetical protein
VLWLEQGHLHPLHRESETYASESGTEPGTSCTAGEHSVQRAIRTALLSTFRNLSLYHYNCNLNQLYFFGCHVNLLDVISTVIVLHTRYTF